MSDDKLVEQVISFLRSKQGCFSLAELSSAIFGATPNGSERDKLYDLLDNLEKHGTIELLYGGLGTAGAGARKANFARLTP